MIRPALPADCAAIAGIWNRVITDTAHTFTTMLKTPQGLADMLAEDAAHGHVNLVCDEAGQVVGYAGYRQFRGGNGYARSMEHSIHLAPAAMGKGLGRALMAALEAQAFARGVHQMIAGVSGENRAGQAFHAAIGYKTVAVIPEAGFKWGRFIDLVLMQKILT